MHHARSGTLPFFLLLIPLLSVPILAIFGIPQLAPLIASPTDVDSDQEPLDAVPLSPQHPVQVAANDTANAAFSINSQHAQPPQLQNSTHAQHATQTHEIAPNSIQQTSFHELQNRQPRNEQHAEAVAMNRLRQSQQKQPLFSHSSVSDTATELRWNWKSARQKLAELNITQFRLEPGNQLEQYIFICSYTPATHPTMTFRFEAEAEEPLLAVERVLQQIEHWHTRQQTNRNVGTGNQHKQFIQESTNTLKSGIPARSVLQ